MDGERLSAGRQGTGPRRIALLVAAIACVPYFLLPAKPLIYDAYPTIVANEAVQSGRLGELFSVDFWGRAPDQNSKRSYRPLVSLSYAIQARSVGNHPALYHLTDIALHAGAAALLVLLMAALGVDRRWLLPAGALFAVHPVQTEAVCSGVGRADILAAVCLFAALQLHLRAPRLRRPMLAHAAAVALIGAALLCKEYAVAFPFLLVLADLARRGEVEPPRAERRRQVWTWLGAFLLLFGYLLLRYRLFGALGGVPMLPVDHPLAGVATPVRWLNALSLLALSLRLLILPYPLNYHYRFGTLPIAESLADWSVLAGLLLLLLVASGSWYACVRRRQAIPAIAAALVLLPLGPSLNTVSLAGVLFAERFLYIPVAGLALIAAWATRGLPATVEARRVVRGSVATVLVGLCLATGLRVEAWSSMERLARASVLAYPGGAEAWKHLGVALAEQGRWEEATAALERAVEINPDDAPAWQVLADSAAARGRHEEAAAAWQRVAALAPGNAGLVSRAAGEAQLRAGRPEVALPLLRQAVEQMPGDPQALYELVRAHLLLKDPRSALDALTAGGDAVAQDRARFAPVLGEALLRLGQARLADGRRDEASSLARRAVAEGALPPPGLFLAGLLAAKAGDEALAQEWFDAALDGDPDLLRRKHELAEQFVEAGRPDRAVDELQEILVARPDHVPTLFNLGRVLVLARRGGEAIAPLRRGLELQEDPRARQLLEQLLEEGRP